MVLSGLTFPRVLFRVVLALGWLATVGGGRAAEPGDLAGTMPEDVFPALKEILDSALRRSPELIQTDFDRAAAEARVIIADSARLPNLRGTSEYATNQTSASGNNSSQSRASGFFYRFEAGQAVFHWNALKNQSLAARTSLQAARTGYAITARVVSVAIRKAYLALVVEKARLRQGRHALKVLQADIDVLSEKKTSGIISPAVLAGEELRKREVLAELERGEAEFASNRRRLARIAGLPELPEEKIADELPEPTYSEPLATKLAATLLREQAKGTPEYEVYSARVREADLRYKIEKTRLLPKINLGAAYSLENNTDVNGNSVNQQAYQRQAVNINAQWNMFDGRATTGAIREALATKRLHERNLEAKMDQTLQETQTLERTLRIDAEQMEISRIRHGLAVQAHRRISEEVEYGKLRRSEVERARLNIFAADVRTFETREKYYGHWCDFIALTAADPGLSLLSDRHGSEKK